MGALVLFHSIVTPFIVNFFFKSTRANVICTIFVTETRRACLRNRVETSRIVGEKMKFDLRTIYIQYVDAAIHFRQVSYTPFRLSNNLIIARYNVGSINITL